MIADFASLELHLTRVLPEYYRHSSWWSLTPLEQERDVRDATKWHMEFGSDQKQFLLFFSLILLASSSVMTHTSKKSHSRGYHLFRARWKYACVKWFSVLGPNKFLKSVASESHNIKNYKCHLKIGSELSYLYKKFKYFKNHTRSRSPTFVFHFAALE